jgi:CTP:molybdopterin cytidylyltransferase MocA
MYCRPVDRPRRRLAAVVLAAGASSRFGGEPGAKLLAQIDGEPMLARILAEVRAFGPALTLVVLGHGADEIERALAWTDEIRVRNHEPERGLSSSLQVGIDALRALPEPLDGAFIVLGDQPRLEAGTMHALEAAAARLDPADRSVILPRYPAEEARNPVLLLRPAWSWVDELEGDHGLGGLIDQRPDQVLIVAVSGAMPDIDTPSDLERLGLRS